MLTLIIFHRGKGRPKIVSGYLFTYIEFLTVFSECLFSPPDCEFYNTQLRHTRSLCQRLILIQFPNAVTAFPLGSRYVNATISTISTSCLFTNERSLPNFRVILLFYIIFVILRTTISIPQAININPELIINQENQDRKHLRKNCSQTKEHTLLLPLDYSQTKLSVPLKIALMNRLFEI